MSALSASPSSGIWRPYIPSYSMCLESYYSPHNRRNRGGGRGREKVREERGGGGGLVPSPQFPLLILRVSLIFVGLADFLFKSNQKTIYGRTSRAWYNGSYAMAAKPIKTLELRYTMIQFLIIGVNRQPSNSLKFNRQSSKRAIFSVNRQNRAIFIVSPKKSSYC